MRTHLSILASLFLVTACSDSEESDRNVEVESSGEGACAGLTVDLENPSTSTPFDGTWAYATGSFEGVMDGRCTPDDRGRPFHLYLAIHEGSYEQYRRVYPTVAACVSAEFDRGGLVEVRESGVVKLCPERYESAKERQVLFVAADADGVLSPWYRFLRDVHDGATWREIQIGSSHSPVPHEVQPGDLWTGGGLRAPL